MFQITFGISIYIDAGIGQLRRHGRHIQNISVSLPAHVLAEKETEFRRGKHVQGDHFRSKVSFDVERLAETVHSCVIYQQVDSNVPIPTRRIEPCRRHRMSPDPYKAAESPHRIVGPTARRFRSTWILRC